MNEAFDINSGAKLMLGSTAKLRTLATYLGIIEHCIVALPNCRQSS